MDYEFSAFGHKKITALHKTTLEFTKDPEMTRNGDCIIGITADFELEQLKKFLTLKRIRIRITADGITDELMATPNPAFNSNHELVIRKTDFCSERTFAVHADKASFDISRRLVRLMQTAILITIQVNEA